MLTLVSCDQSNSQKLLRSVKIKRKDNAAEQDFVYLSVYHTCCIFMHCSSSSLLVLVCQGNLFGVISLYIGGGVSKGVGLRGWVADWRQAVISFSAWHLSTAANPPLISSRPCAWQQKGFEISPSPQVKNRKPYHFVTSTFRVTEAVVPLMCWSWEHWLPRCFKYIMLLALMLLLFLFI